MATTCIKEIAKKTFCGKEVFPGSPSLCIEHEVERLRVSEEAWRKAYYACSSSLGHAQWNHYYLGANAERASKVYDVEFGRKFYRYEG